MLSFCCHTNTHLLAGDALGGEILSTVFKATLNKVGVESDEILHLQGRMVVAMSDRAKSSVNVGPHLLVLNHGGDLSLFGLVVASEVHAEEE